MSAARALPEIWRRRGLAAWLLWPLSLLYRLAVALRRLGFRSGLLQADRLPVPVVVVGNVVAGGAGKTPLTLHLARALTVRGHRPVVVSRGHGGQVRGAHQVSPEDSPLLCGDEALLLARRSGVPVWVGRRRAEVARAAMRRHPECDVVLCDDGLQHYALARDIEIAVLDRRGLMNGFHLPAGPLREPASRLQEVDALVLNGTDAMPVGGPRTFRMALRGETFRRLDRPDESCHASDLRGLRLHALAGIGEPARFFDHLRGLGLEFVEHAFADHHPYSRQDLEFEDCDAMLLTEKDAVKCHGLSDTPMWVLPVEAHLDPDLAGHVSARLAELKHGPPSS